MSCLTAAGGGSGLNLGSDFMALCLRKCAIDPSSGETITLIKDATRLWAASVSCLVAYLLFSFRIFLGYSFIMFFKCYKYIYAILIAYQKMTKSNEKNIFFTSSDLKLFV